MSWETRNGRGEYYTRSRRQSGQIVREYVGSGDVATVFAQLDALKGQERQAELAQRREQRAADERLDATLDDFCRLAEAAARAELLAGAGGNRRENDAGCCKGSHQTDCTDCMTDVLPP